jgi:hypothetical protein
LSKWLERSPLMSYPRPWRGKLARIKGADGLRPIGDAAHALVKPVMIVNSCIGLETRT